MSRQCSYANNGQRCTVRIGISNGPHIFCSSHRQARTGLDILSTIAIERSKTAIQGIEIVGQTGDIICQTNIPVMNLRCEYGHGVLCGRQIRPRNGEEPRTLCWEHRAGLSTKQAKLSKKERLWRNKIKARIRYYKKRANTLHDSTEKEDALMKYVFYSNLITK